MGSSSRFPLDRRNLLDIHANCTYQPAFVTGADPGACVIAPDYLALDVAFAAISNATQLGTALSQAMVRQPTSESQLSLARCQHNASCTMAPLYDVETASQPAAATLGDGDVAGMRGHHAGRRHAAQRRRRAAVQQQRSLLLQRPCATQAKFLLTTPDGNRFARSIAVPAVSDYDAVGGASCAISVAGSQC